MRIIISFMFALSLALLGCSDGDGPGGDGSTNGNKDGTGSGETLPWPDQFVKKDTKPKSCTVGAANACGDDKTLYCKDSVCTVCPEYSYNCDLVRDCECIGACNGATCVGTLACTDTVKDSCGDNKKWCSNGACSNCAKGTFNCDGIKDCECSGKGCDGTTCKP